MTLSTLAATMPADDMALLASEIDWRVLAFALLVGAGTSVMFGLFPAVHVTLRRRRRSAGRRRRMAGSRRAANRFRTCWPRLRWRSPPHCSRRPAFCVSLVNLARTEIGIRREGLVTFRLSPYLNGTRGNGRRRCSTASTRSWKLCLA